MNRLTAREKSGAVYFPQCFDKDAVAGRPCEGERWSERCRCECGTCKWELERNERLAQYEETGLTPEEVVALKASFEQFKKEAEPLLRAKIDERIPGNVVYFMERDEETGELMVESVVSATGFFSTYRAAQLALKGVRP